MGSGPRLTRPPRRPLRRVVFGYTNVDWEGITFCPCRDPGNYLMMETLDGRDRLVCWCGRSARIKFDSPQERVEFIAAHHG